MTGAADPKGRATHLSSILGRERTRKGESELLHESAPGMFEYDPANGRVSDGDVIRVGRE